MNPVAERLTGWTLQEAVGLPLSAVYSLCDQQSRAPSPNPVEQAMKEGAVVGLSLNMVLVRRDLAPRPLGRRQAGEPTGRVVRILESARTQIVADSARCCLKRCRIFSSTNR